MKKELTGDDVKQEFKQFEKFAFKQRMIELAVAFILGSAFQNAVTAISNYLIMPLIKFVLNKTGENWRCFTYTPLEGMTFEVGKFLGAFIDFLLIAIVLYIIYQKIILRLVPKEADMASCQYCLSVINKNCLRCPQCTSYLKEVKNE